MNNDSKTLLVVDDEQDLCESISFVFDDAGYQTFLAHNILQAKELLQEHHIAFVISDVRLPDASGIDLLHWIQQGHAKQMSQVILISGYIDAELQEAEFSAAKAVLKKPIELEELFQVVENLRN
ncbi:MAG: response regulator [Oligoflexus sp.]